MTSKKLDDYLAEVGISLPPGVVASSMEVRLRGGLRLAKWDTTGYGDVTHLVSSGTRVTLCGDITPERVSLDDDTGTIDCPGCCRLLIKRQYRA